jgi:hypothetical protein
MPRRASNSLTRNQNRLLRTVAGGGTLHADRRRPQLVFAHGKGESFRTQRTVLRGLIQDDLLLVVGGDMTDVEVTQKGLRALDRLGGYPKRRLPEVLHPLVRPIALQRLAELRALGFEDPVDALLALAYETDEQGEFAQPVEVRIEALKAAAPFCRPKLAAVVQRNVGEGKSHTEWLEELRGYVEQEELEHDDHQGPTIEGTAVNGKDPGEPPDEPDGAGGRDAGPDQDGPVWKSQSK